MQSIMQMKANYILDCTSHSLAACQWKQVSARVTSHVFCIQFWSPLCKKDTENWTKSSKGQLLGTI